MDFDGDRFRSGLFISKCTLKLYFESFTLVTITKKQGKVCKLFLVCTGNFSVRHTFQRPATFKSNNNKHYSNHNWLHSLSLMYSIILRLNQCCVTNGTEYKASSVWHLLTTLTGSEGAFFFWSKSVTCLYAPLSANGRPAGAGLGSCLLFPVSRDIHIVRRRQKCCVRATCWPWRSPVRAGSVSATSPGFRASAPATDSTGRPVLLPLCYLNVATQEMEVERPVSSAWPH